MDSRHYCFLRRCTRQPIKISDIDDDEQSIYNYLVKQGYITPDYNRNGEYTYVTEHGKDAAYHFVDGFIRVRVALIISIIALLVSMLSLILGATRQKPQDTHMTKTVDASCQAEFYRSRSLVIPCQVPSSFHDCKDSYVLLPSIHLCMIVYPS